MRVILSPRPKIELDETELAQRLAIGDTMLQCAESLGVTHPVITRRVRAWRRRIADAVESDPAQVLYWRDKASPGRVARRWLFMQTGEERWAPLDFEDY
ncbi:MAG: hypothetical protein KC468_37125 [Myxococcales bacterium]|nr:hypothetical protein [Myxococcales bacterium]